GGGPASHDLPDHHGAAAPGELLPQPGGPGGAEVRVGLQYRLGQLAGLLDDLAVVHQVSHGQLRQARLPGAAQVTGPAQPEVQLGDREAVGVLDERLEPAARLPGGVAGDEQAEALVRAAAHAPAELVELREAEALGVLYDHHGGVGDVHAHLDDGGGDE